MRHLMQLHECVNWISSSIEINGKQQLSESTKYIQNNKRSEHYQSLESINCRHTAGWTGSNCGVRKEEQSEERTSAARVQIRDFDSARRQ